ncbi:hypothetical protein EBAPG3_013990 [Nitrosospira lacus]|uniref:Alpha/beta hydrolase n=1 Tax=Nitrosospira lacus TaxID=1288494 RepID=A0A1W6SSK0_9PROT|nr:hypothetical protein [Nitrosospira lacus]ARO88788.1 hypothetical protein EBAPG3_013990 [Nitrosospira lacus]
MLTQVACAMENDSVTHHAALKQGVVLHRALANDSRQEYFLYVPHGSGNDAKIFVTVHGISRNAKEHAQKFAPFAEKYKVIMIAPYFPTDRFPDYQRLGREGKGERADVALNKVVAEVANLTGANAHRLYLFGYSGGAQFVHRYMLGYPERVAKVVLGAPGWYTFPDTNLKYPHGIQRSRSLPRMQFSPADFLAIPVCVLVGERDNRRDAELNKSPQIDLLQGKTRLERGRRWVDAMKRQAHAFGLITSYVFRTLPHSPHSFTLSMQRGEMGEKTFDFLFINDGNPDAS